jgi:ArsR family metal-binding transcriptional regulator
MMNTNQVPEADKLIHGYSLKLIEPPCVPGADTWSAKAYLEDDITDVLPYLNAELEGADYYHDSKVLILDDGTKKCAFRPHEIAVAPVDDREEAGRLIDELVRRANEIWKRRNQIEANFEREELPSLMELYKLLPRTNCKECGHLTCMAYATHLREGGKELSKCTHLSAQNREKLLHLLRKI